MKCPVCQWEFTSDNAQRIYCSSECCARAYQRRKRGVSIANPRPRPCIECGKEFTPIAMDSAKYCSDNCRWRVNARKRGGFKKRKVEYAQG